MVSTAGAGLPPAPPSDDVLRPGSKAGPWLVERELGRGGMGAVYAVVHEEIGKRAALKVVHRRLMPGLHCDRMLLEAQVVNQVGHPSIVDIFETGRLEDGRPYIVMERLCGQSLAVRADEGKLLPDAVIAILLQVCDALIAAHEAGIVHRDLKLDNVFLVDGFIDGFDDAAQPRVKLLDWGIAKVIHHEVRHTIEGQLMGTPQYLSPEQARGLAVSPRTDVYSLGVMAYELFLEQLPFEAETAAEVMAMHLRAAPPPPRELWPDIPAELEELLLAMLAKQPDQRPMMAEVARRLEAVRAELQRRKHHAPRRPSTARAASRTALQPGRVKSPRFAPTEPFAWRSETRRWQYAIGGLALAVSGLMFWISRAGDRAASAATAPGAMLSASPAPVRALHPVEPVGAQIAVTGSQSAAHSAVHLLANPADPPAPDASELSASDAAPLHMAGARPGDLVLRPAVAVEPAAPPATHRARRARSPATSAGSGRVATPPAASPSSPVMPRLRAKVDPDGTLDVYR